MSLEDCLGAAEECNAPMVSICGGEPLIYPHIEALVEGIACAKTHRLHLHERHVHAQEDARVAGLAVAGTGIGNLLKKKSPACFVRDC